MQGALPVRWRDPSYREGWEEFCSRKTGHSASFREGKMQDSSGVGAVRGSTSFFHFLPQTEGQ